MELFPKFKERGVKEIEMVEGMKKSIVALCEQMKGNLEAGAYDAIISDEGGGRIPTLLISEIYKQASKKKFPTLFVASGMGYGPNNENDETTLLEYLRKGIPEAKKVLLVTQYLRTGKSTNHLIEYLRKHGVEHVEIATLESGGPAFEGSDADVVYKGGTLDTRQGNFAENHSLLSGIAKSKAYDPMPIRLDKALDTGNVERTRLMDFSEHKDFIGHETQDSVVEIGEKTRAATSKYEELAATPLTADEKRDIQENINRTRATIKKLAKEIVAEVW
jgi:hypoxanthine phosphoribosyltransferase